MSSYLCHCIMKQAGAFISISQPHTALLCGVLNGNSQAFTVQKTFEASARFWVSSHAVRGRGCQIFFLLHSPATTAVRSYRPRSSVRSVMGL